MLLQSERILLAGADLQSMPRTHVIAVRAYPPRWRGFAIRAKNPFIAVKATFGTDYKSAPARLSFLQ